MSAEHATTPGDHQDIQDRRDFMRLDKSGRGLLRLQGEDRPVGSGRIVDICANGLSLRCESEWADRIEAGVKVEVVARIDEASEPFYLIGEVAWSRQLDTGQCQIGIEIPLTDASAEQARHDNRDWRALFLA